MESLTRHDCRWSRLRLLEHICTFLLCCLLWRPTTAAPGLTAADYYVDSLPGAPDGPLLRMHAGHIEVDPETNGNLFFWLFHNRHLADRSRTVIWLNGGPGCSSMDGALMEVGPYRVRPGGKLEYNNGSWDEFANVLFVDQPVGTGFSYVNTNAYLHDLDQMADQMTKFLGTFFDVFPELRHDDLYFAGESYAGQHIPYIARAIIERNKARAVQPWNLKGLLIGNGWTSPRDQYPAYLKFAYNASIIMPGSDQAKDVEAQQKICDTRLQSGGDDHVDTDVCESILQKILDVTKDMNKPKSQQCYNMYDIRLRDEYSSCGMNWPPDLKDVTPYLRRSDVKDALHIDTAKQAGWVECSGAVSGAFKARNSAPAVALLPDILDAAVPILMFSGDKDMICNHLGTEALIRNLAWSGGKGFETSPGNWAPRRDWIFEEEAAGYYQAARNLTYVVFYNASHMVPFDYPRRTRDMLDRFMGVDIGGTGGEPKQSLIDGEQAGPETSVGGHPNSTAAAEAEKGKVKQAEVKAYYRSGEVALVVVVIAAGAWGWWVWKERRRRRFGYAGVPPADGDDAAGPSAGQVFEGMRDAAFQSLSSATVGGGGAGGGGGGGGRLSGARGAANGFAWRKGRRDLEAADFDEAELDNMTPAGEKRYDLADDDDDEDGESGSEGRGSSQGSGKPLHKPNGGA